MEFIILHALPKLLGLEIVLFYGTKLSVLRLQSWPLLIMRSVYKSGILY